MKHQIQSVAQMNGLLRELRKKSGLTAVQLANRANVSTATVSYYENGQRGLRLEKLEALCKCMGHRIEILVIEE